MGRCARTLLTAALLLGLATLSEARAVVRSSAGDVEVARAVQFMPRRGTQLPLDTVVNDERGAISLAELTQGQPFILTMVWFACRNLCGLTLNGLAHSLSETRSRPGEELAVIVLSLDPDEPASAAGARKRQLATQYPKANVESAWHFVTASEQSVDAISEAIGFKYVYDVGKQQFAHPAGIVAVAANGRLTDYLAGINYTTRAVDEMMASVSGVAPPARTNPVLLLCYEYDPQTGQYSFAILKTLRLIALLVIVAVGAFMLNALYRERKKHRDE